MRCANNFGVGWIALINGIYKLLSYWVGRIHHAMGNINQAISYLSQGLQIAESLGRREEEARIRHRLGLALWDNGQLEMAYVHLDQAASLLEIIRKESTGSTDYKLSLFDLQTASYQALQVKNISLCSWHR